MIKVTASVAMSLDGYIDDATDQRLKLSSDEDWSSILSLRSSCDAILVGAGTLRSDNPSLKGCTTKVTVTRSGDIDITSKFFTVGGCRKIVFVDCLTPLDRVAALEQVAEVVVLNKITAMGIVAALDNRGVNHLMVEGGAKLHTLFFEEDVVDDLRLAVAPFFVGGGDGATRFVEDGSFVAGKDNRMSLVGVEQLGDMAVMNYHRDRTDRYYMMMALAQSRFCVPSQSSYCVGAVIVTISGDVYSGYTHQTADNNHAEEEAIQRAVALGVDLQGATIYCTMEPCSQRASKPKSCTQHIIEQRFARVVIALCEPAHFVTCEGVSLLEANGVAVDFLPEFAQAVEAINSHILQ